MTVRQYVPWGLMVLSSAWLLLVLFPVNSSMLWLMTTDGCGQVLQPETLSAVGTLASVLKWTLIAAFFIEILLPRVSWSAWVLVSLPIAGFFMASSAVALLNSDFLTRCDVLFFRPKTIVQVNVIGVIAVAVTGVKRLRH